MTREERLAALGIKTEITDYVRVSLNDVTLGSTNARRSMIAGRMAYRINTPLSRNFLHSEVDIYDAARAIENAALAWLETIANRMALPETCPPEVHDALVAYFVGFGVGAHTTTRASDKRVNVMGVTPKCVVSPDELWQLMRTAISSPAIAGEVARAVAPEGAHITLPPETFIPPADEIEQAATDLDLAYWKVTGKPYRVVAFLRALAAAMATRETGA